MVNLPAQANGSRSYSARLLGDRAVVLGGSMSGLLTARVLADFYRQVTIVDRDVLGADQGGPRRGVPQGRHTHLLLPRGARVLEELFPGLLGELVDAGVPVPRRLPELYFDFQGHVLSQELLDEEDAAYGASRPLLESTVRRRVLMLPNVSLLDRHDVISLVPDSGRSRVIGARIACEAALNGESVLDADLVVAATGRSGRVGVWLESLGYPKPREQELKVDLLYVTRRFRLSPEFPAGKSVVLIGPTAARPTGMGAIAQEGGHWIVTLFGLKGHHPPTADGAWLDLAERLAPPFFGEALRSGKPIGETHTHRFPANLRRRYDRLRAFPDGLLVVGDAMCSFNPIYGQGMTVAALEALALRDTLRTGPENLAGRFFRAAAKPVGSAWQLAVGADLAMPAEIVPGARSLPLRAVNAYIDGFQAAAEHDPELAFAFLKVTGFEEPARTLFAPGNLRRMANQRLHRLRRSDGRPGSQGVELDHAGGAEIR